MFPTLLSESFSSCGRGYSDDPLVIVDEQEPPMEVIDAPVKRRTRSCHQGQDRWKASALPESVANANNGIDHPGVFAELFTN